MKVRVMLQGRRLVWSPDNLQVFSRMVETGVDAGGDCMETSKEGVLWDNQMDALSFGKQDKGKQGAVILEEDLIRRYKEGASCSAKGTHSSGGAWCESCPWSLPVSLGICPWLGGAAFGSA